MSLAAAVPQISKQELLTQLERGRSAGLTVVTPNQRLAASLRGEFDRHQSQRGLAGWETADVLPLGAFVERLYADALYSPLGPRLPFRLTDAQELLLWEQVIAGSPEGARLLSVPSAAALARDGWRLAQAWRLLPRMKGQPLNENARAFADWAWRYEEIAARSLCCDQARLADVLIPHIGDAALEIPQTLVAYGFDILSTQQSDLMAALQKAGCRLLVCGPQPRAGAAVRLACANAAAEIEAAARWARARLEAEPRARIGIVVPDLARSREQVRRALTAVFAPERALPCGERTGLPINISLGEPLASYHLAAAAFLVLELARAGSGAGLAFPAVSRLLRSPFIAGGEAELAPRARLEAELRRVCGAHIGLEPLRRTVTEMTDPENRYAVCACPILVRRLTDFAAMARERCAGARAPGEWARVISALLQAIGYPGDRALASEEFQVLAKFREALGRLGALDRFAPRMRFDEACQRLRRIAADTPFQPEGSDAPIQVLGVLESAGLEFDHLWVLGLSEQAWPMAAHPNPFVPVVLQRAAGVPEASASASLELDARITRGWIAAAQEVVLSHPLFEEDRELLASPLIEDVPASSLEELALPEYADLHQVIRRSCSLEKLVDRTWPPIEESAVNPGGTAIFKDQAACPFRAFAAHRLRARALEEPVPGLDAAERGTLMHVVLARLWQELKSHAGLVQAQASEIDALLDRVAGEAIAKLQLAKRIPARLLALERSRVAALARQWLEVERARAPFEVALLEGKRELAFGGVRVNARLDRMDRVAGGCAIIDYKTGRGNVGDWIGERPDDPQLPLYALAGGENIVALAFARLKAGELGFKGLAQEDGLIPGATVLHGRMHAGAEPDTEQDTAHRATRLQLPDSWEDLLDEWRSELDALGRTFAAGEAQADPKRGEETCRHCELKPLCRINASVAL